MRNLDRCDGCLRVRERRVVRRRDRARSGHAPRGHEPERRCGTGFGVVRDRRSWRNFGLPKSLWRNRTNPLLSKRFRKSLAEYYRADFHPLDRDTSELEDAWRSWLDGGGPGRCKPREPR